MCTISIQFLEVKKANVKQYSISKYSVNVWHYYYYCYIVTITVTNATSKYDTSGQTIMSVSNNIKS